jgi:hypothetical protein
VVKANVLVKMVIITTKPCQHVRNVTPTVRLVMIITLVLNVMNQESQTIVFVQMVCGITTEFVKIVQSNVKHVLMQLMIVIFAQITELEMIVTVQMLIMTTIFQENAQNVVVNVQNVILMVV